LGVKTAFPGLRGKGGVKEKNQPGWVRKNVWTLGGRKKKRSTLSDGIQWITRDGGWGQLKGGKGRNRGRERFEEKTPGSRAAVAEKNKWVKQFCSVNKCRHLGPSLWEKEREKKGKKKRKRGRRRTLPSNVLIPVPTPVYRHVSGSRFENSEGWQP